MTRQLPLEYYDKITFAPKIGNNFCPKIMTKTFFSREGWLRHLGYYDFAGSGVVHLTGGKYNNL